MRFKSPLLFIGLIMLCSLAHLSSSSEMPSPRRPTAQPSNQDTHFVEGTNRPAQIDIANTTQLEVPSTSRPTAQPPNQDTHLVEGTNRPAHIDIVNTTQWELPSTSRPTAQPSNQDTHLVEGTNRPAQIDIVNTTQLEVPSTNRPTAQPSNQDTHLVEGTNRPAQTDIVNTTQWEIPTGRRLPAKPPNEDDLLVEETDRLLTEGEVLTVVDPSRTDIVMVIGNTGAGKTTITKFLAQIEHLESYDTGSRYLIRDRMNQKISGKSTLVSKTIFPELIVDNQTNTVFYDLPGFSDTRSASIEIANACFMKKVADHAQRVKLLFIVNHSSLRDGESRTDFKTFLEHATDLIKSPSRFNSSIALVATKVEQTRRPKPPHMIIKGIASFLETAKSVLHEVFPDKAKLEAAIDLIDAILSKDSNGTYNRISYFLQPDDEGPLTDFPEIMAQKTHMETILYRNIEFTSKSPEDFGFSVSSGSKLIIMKLGERINDKIKVALASTGKKLQAHLTSIVKNVPWSALGNLIKGQRFLENFAQILNSAKSLQEFKLLLQELLSRAQLIDATKDEKQELERRENNLKFLQQISSTSSPPKILDWSQPIQEAVKATRAAVTKKVGDFNSFMKRQIHGFGQQIYYSFHKKIEPLAGNEEKKQKFEYITSSLNTIGSSLANVSSVNMFIQRMRSHVMLVDPSISTENLTRLNEDVEFNESDFQIFKWIQPFEKLTSKLLDEKYQVSTLALQESNLKDKAEMQEKMQKLREAIESEKIKQQESRKLLAQQLAEQKQKYEVLSNNQQQMAEMQKQRAEIEKLLRGLQQKAGITNVTNCYKCDETAHGDYPTCSGKLGGKLVSCPEKSCIVRRFTDTGAIVFQDCVNSGQGCTKSFKAHYTPGEPDRELMECVCKYNECNGSRMMLSTKVLTLTAVVCAVFLKKILFSQQ